MWGIFSTPFSILFFEVGPPDESQSSSVASLSGLVSPLLPQLDNLEASPLPPKAEIIMSLHVHWVFHGF